MKCPQCGLVTFDDLPACPRCKESFALVRPLASSTLAGARHMLRDDPELRLKLRERLHRARLDRRKNNNNPLDGSDPDAPDWFEPEVAGGNGAAEVTLAPTPGADEREEGQIVPIDDRSPDDNTRASGKSSGADDADLIEASRERDDAEPEFDGEIPGFTDWREELRERLKRIRARRKQEAEEAARRAADLAAEQAEDTEVAVAAATEDEDDDENDEAAGADSELGEGPEGDEEAVDDDGAQDEAEADDVGEGEPRDEDDRDDDADELDEEDEEDTDDDADELDEEEDEDADDDADELDDEDDEDADDDADEDEEDTDDDADELDDEDEEDADDDADELDEEDEEDADDDADELDDDDDAVADGEGDEDEEVGSGDEPDATEHDDRAWAASGSGMAPAGATAKDLIARLVDGPGGDRALRNKPRAFGDKVDFIIERDEIDEDAAEGEAEDMPAPDSLILGEKDAESSIAGAADTATIEVEVSADGDEEEDDDPTVELDEEGDEETTLDLDAEFDEDDVLELDDADEDDDLEGTVAAGGAAVSTGRSSRFDWGDATISESRLERDEIEDQASETERTDDKVEGKAAGKELPDDEIATADGDADDDMAEDAVAGEEATTVDVVTAKPEAADRGDADKRGKASTLPPVIMPDKPAPELDFEPPDVMRPSPKIDLPAELRADAATHGIEWDDDTGFGTGVEASSAAPLGERAAASVCDALVLVAIGAALVGAASSGTEVPFREILVQETLWLALAWTIFAVGYSIFLVGACGQTIGRMVMRLRVIGDDQFSVGFDRATIRLAAWVVSALPALAGMLPALKDPQRRALHDRLSHTRVVKA